MRFLAHSGRNIRLRRAGEERNDLLPTAHVLVQNVIR
jgi:hypothetical protein